MKQRVSVALLSVVVLLTGCCDHGTEPTPIQAVLYVGAGQIVENPREYRIYVLSADSLTLLDSLVLDQLPLDMSASPDGKWLYFRVSYSQGVNELRKVDALTGDLAWSVPYYGFSSLLDNGKVLAVGRDIRKTSTGELLRTAPDTLILADGDPAGARLAAVVGTEPTFYYSDSVVVRYDVRTGEVNGRYVPRVGSDPLVWLYRARLHRDGHRVGVIGIRFATGDAWFVLGDLNTGETLLTHRLRYPYGEIAFSSDGRLAAVADAGWLGFDYNPNTLDLFDLESLVHIKRIATPPGDFDPDSFTFVGQVHFTDSDQRLITVPVENGVGRIHIINLSTFTIEASTGLPGSESYRLAPLIGGSVSSWRTIE